MHSSAISLIYDLEKNPLTDPLKTKDIERYLINLVDSPGHLDFSSDVSTATRLCDGALIVVDVLEGICTQTHAVIYKALKERLRPCLVLNKVDRLILDMKLTSVEAFYHLRRLMEKTNALAYTLVDSEIRSYEESKVSTSAFGAKVGTSTTATAPGVMELNAEKLLEEWQLSPEKGNVIFASALDCWGFGIGRFSNLWAMKLGLNRNVLQKYFFSDYSLDLQEKKILKYDPSHSSNPAEKPMFVAMILDPIWQLYESALVNSDPERAAKLALKVTINLTV
ncbi:unnamed protein product [Sphagnum jensenii]|uniref:Tr-type G domain-containing protein n=1 Tax=Sphagnum jensenii TaxID=128206 RepID=A0ABP0VAC5_9BRYO